MWAAILSVLQWVLKYWKTLVGWVGTSLVATWGVFKAIDGLKTVHQWAFGHWTEVFDKAVEFMDDASISLSNWTSVDGGLAGGLLDFFEVDFLVDVLIGYGAFCLTVFEILLTGIFFALVTLAISLLVVKFKFFLVKQLST